MTSTVVKKFAQPFTQGTFACSNASKLTTLSFTGKDASSAAWKTELTHTGTEKPTSINWQMDSEGKMQLGDGTQKKEIQIQ